MGSVSSIDELRSDPERLLRAGVSPDALELSLLGSLQSIAVPPGAKALVWKGLATQVAGLGAASASGSWLSTWWQDAIKLLTTSKGAALVPVVIAALGVGAVQYHHSPGKNATNTVAPAAAPPAPAPVATASAAPTEASASELELEPEESFVSPPPARVRTLSALRDQLSEESALLERARAELRGGHPRAAEATLLRMQSRFPRGALTQEREVLLIQALAARGNAVAAERDARSFVAAHPESPHAVQLRRFYARAN